MSRTQDAAPIITALEHVIAAVEGREVPARRFQTSQLVFAFTIDSPALLPQHEAFLDTVQEFVSTNPDATIVSVVGRASQTGPERNNQSLAFDHAETVRAYLIAAGVPASRIGPTIASGSGRPLIDVPGREAEVNRSVELLLDWEEVIQPTPPRTPGASTQWRLQLDVTFGFSKLFGGQIQVGRLYKVTPGRRDVSRGVSAWIAGIDVSKSLGPVASYSVPGPSPIDSPGEFTMPDPPGAVDFDWFDSHAIMISSAGASAVVGGSATNVTFLQHGKWPTTRFIDYPLGFTFGLGASHMLGFLNVDQ